MVCVFRQPATSNVTADSLGWDVATWSRALPFWSDRTRLGPGARALEVGAGGHNAGLSLWLAVQGIDVTCSGLQPPSEAMRRTHEAYGVADRVTYTRADVLTLPYVAEFDLVVFKSVLGGVGENGRFDRQVLALRRLHAALKPGSELWWAENVAGTPLHSYARNRLGAGRHRWRYLQLDELPVLLAPFAESQVTTFGVLAAMGRGERQRRALASVDAAVLDRITPVSWRYAAAGLARKAD